MSASGWVMLFPQGNIRLQDFFALQTLQNRKKYLVPDGLAICANSQSFTNDLLIWEALFSGLRATCWIKAVRIKKKNTTSKQ